MNYRKIMRGCSTYFFEDVLRGNLDTVGYNAFLYVKCMGGVGGGGYSILAYLMKFLLLKKAIFNQLWVCTFQN